MRGNACSGQLIIPLFSWPPGGRNRHHHRHLCPYGKPRRHPGDSRKQGPREGTPVYTEKKQERVVTDYGSEGKNGCMTVCVLCRKEVEGCVRVSVHARKIYQRTFAK